MALTDTLQHRSHTQLGPQSPPAALPHAALEITKGADALGKYQVDDGQKHFCSHCGTPIFNLNAQYPGVCMIYFGTLDKARDLTPRLNVWYENRLEWTDNIPAIASLNQGVARK
jgi:hypothetical protein